MNENLNFSDWLTQYRINAASEFVTSQYDGHLSNRPSQIGQSSFLVKSKKTQLASGKLQQEVGQFDICYTTGKSIDRWKTIPPSTYIKCIDEKTVWEVEERVLRASLNWDTIQLGSPVVAEDIMRQVMNNSSAMEMSRWIYDLFLQNSKDILLICTLLHAFSHLEYEIVKPFGPMMAMAMLGHTDDRVLHYAIKAFANWNSKDSLNYLSSLAPLSRNWARKELERVMDYIKCYGDEDDGLSDERVYALQMETRTA